jgi:hypothetical protein
VAAQTLWVLRFLCFTGDFGEMLKREVSTVWTLQFLASR